MDLTVSGSGGSMNIPVSALNMFDTIAILLLVPIFDRFVYPYFKKTGKPLSMLTKIGWGIVFALLSMVVAAGVEVYRVQEAPPAGNYSSIAARNNISPCQEISDYNPYQFQSYLAGLSDTSAAYCYQT